MSRIVIYEKRGDWARAFRRLGFFDQVVETRHLDACSSLLEQFPGSVTAIEVSSSECRRIAEWLTATRWSDGRTTHLAMIEDGQPELGWLLRQLGAACVLGSRLDLFRAVPLIRKHLARNLPQPLSLDERIWNNLPWSNR